MPIDTSVFLLAPPREGRLCELRLGLPDRKISTRAPTGGATKLHRFPMSKDVFLLAPPREGRRAEPRVKARTCYFYSRPHGRGDGFRSRHRPRTQNFYSRPHGRGDLGQAVQPLTDRRISTRAPTGGATEGELYEHQHSVYFYSRPHGRGDSNFKNCRLKSFISTRAPTGGATAIFHKVDAVFCGELPKDHAVFYEIFPVCQRNLSKSRENQKNFCADLPRNYVREGSALEDQGASGFYERLFSHGLDPILIGIAQPIEADGVLLQVNDLFQFIF